MAIHSVYHSVEESTTIGVVAEWTPQIGKRRAERRTQKRRNVERAPSGQMKQHGYVKQEIVPYGVL